jgi:hypothetical protein
MLIPRLPDLVQILDDDFPKAVQFLRSKTVIIRQGDGIQPEFADFSISTHVRMSRFITVKAVKKEAILAGNARNCRHERSL